MSGDDLIDALHDGLFCALVGQGIDDLTALREAGALVEDVQRRIERVWVYVPAEDKATRDARIAADLAAGGDRDDVAARHGISKKTVTRAVRRRRPDDDDGFGSPEWNL